MVSFLPEPEEIPNDDDEWVSEPEESVNNEWLSNANDVFEFEMHFPYKMNQSNIQHETKRMKLETVKKYHPVFTYPFFENEQIFGYKDLKIKFAFIQSSMKFYLNVDYKQKHESLVGITDDFMHLCGPIIEKAFNSEKVENLEWTRDQHLFQQWLKQESEHAFELLNGQKISDYQIDGRKFEVYQQKWETKNWKQLMNRLQIHLLFFIEGANYLNEEEEEWQFFILYFYFFIFRVERRNAFVDLIGYVSCFEFWHPPDLKRMRISQFFVFPVYQKQGHGSRFYQIIMETLRKFEKVVDICVEDPTETFSDMRTKCDFLYLLGHESLLAEYFQPKDFRLPTKEEKKNLRLQLKFNSWQFDRLLEIYAIYKYGLSDSVRIWIKKRIYKKNEEALKMIQNKEERLKTIEETYQNLIGEYYHIMDSIRA